MFARWHVFTVKDGALIPVEHPDPQTLDELPGYEAEREKIVANTQALLDGRPANNVLLYGRRGNRKIERGQGHREPLCAGRPAPRRGEKTPAVSDPETDGFPCGEPAQIHPVHRRSELHGQRRQLRGAQGHPRRQRRRAQREHRRVRDQQPPPSHQGDAVGPRGRRHPPRRHDAGADEPVGALRPDGDIPAPGQRPFCAHRHGACRALRRRTFLTTNSSCARRRFAIRSGGRSPRVARQFIELYRSGVL